MKGDVVDIDTKVALLKTIADPTRLRILGLLAEGSRTGAELAAELGLSAPTISHHLHRLEGVGVVGARAEAQRRYWSIDEALLVDARRVEADAAAPAADAPPRDPEAAKVLRSFFDGERLRSIPTKRKARVIVLLELLRGFEPGRRYSEAEVNAILRRAHDDVALLRRELVDYRYLRREAGVYWLTEDAPSRDANEAQEVPGGEAEWLAALIRGAVGTATTQPPQV